MPTAELRPAVKAAIEDALSGRRLLEHPFYRRWEMGELEMSELSAYAEQYRHFEAMLPEFLGSLAAVLPEGEARDFIEANLADELSTPRPHLELLDEFAVAVGAPETAGTPATPATAALVATYSRALESGPAAALGTLAAYEVQSADIAASKGDGLRNRYGIGPAGTAFWDVHAEVDRAHADWTVDAVDALMVEDDAEQVLAGVRNAADAWWAFLDEREALRPVAA